MEPKQLANRADRPPLDPNRTHPEVLVADFGLRAEIAHLLWDGRPYRSISQLLRSPRFAERATFRELALVIAGARSTIPLGPRPPVVAASQFEEFEGLRIGETIDTAKVRRVFIATENGQELVSANLGPDTNGLDHASIRFLGLNPWDLPYLLRAERETFYALLHSAEARRAGELWKRLERDERKDSRLEPISSISQLLRSLQDFSQPVKYVTNAEDPCEGSDGCTYVPDWDWGSCCDEHDRCYCRGGSDEDRQKCDDALYSCMKAKGHSIMAAIYRWGVETFSASHFNIWDSQVYREVGTPTVSVTTDNPATPGCHITVWLIEVEYRGDDIGNDWTYSAAVNGNSTKLLDHGTHNHEATRYYNSKLYDNVLAGRCGDALNLVLSANAREDDAIDDDTGSASVSLEVRCDPGHINTYDKQLKVSVKEAIKFWPDDHGHMYFFFRVETECA